jgi:hypothetical protein
MSFPLQKVLHLFEHFDFTTSKMFRQYNGCLAEIIFFLFFTGCVSHPVQEIAQVIRDVSELNDSYDYIIVGGGTSGLTVADRLSADGKSKGCCR